ncbi:hypothetical protein [Spiroplasma endosymbiont of Stenodema calcarata]
MIFLFHQEFSTKLKKKGYLMKTSRGRVLTNKTVEFLKNIA